MAMRLTSLVALFGLAAGSLEEGLQDDGVTFVQTDVSKRAGTSAAERSLHEFRLEDAESLVDVAYRAAHDESKASVEEKAIALLQNLAEHRSVVGTGAKDALLRVAAEAQRQGFGAAAAAEAEAEAEVEAEEEVDRASYEAKSNTSRHDYDWVPITGDQGEQEGYCWHSLGGKPLQCQIKMDILAANLLENLYGLKDMMAEEDFANPCEALCAKYAWCSGYGYQQILKPKPDVKDKFGPDDPKKPPKNPDTKHLLSREACVLFNNGRGKCGERGTDFVQNGILPVSSARDLVLKQEDEVEADNDDGVRAVMELAKENTPPYMCKAKYSERPAKWYFNKDVDFQLRSDDTKCKHVLSKPDSVVFIKEIKVYNNVFAFIDRNTYVDEEGNKRPWANECEKLCAILPWCTGYAYRPWSQEEQRYCGLYRATDELPSNQDSWVDNTKQESEAMRKLKKINKPPSTGGKIATHFVRDEEQAGFFCKAKVYETRWRMRSGASLACATTGPVGAFMTAVMSLVSFLGAATCDSVVQPDARASANASLSPSSSSVVLHADAPNVPGLVDPESFKQMFAVNSSGVSAHFTKGQAKAAIERYANDTEDDSRAIDVLRSRRRSPSQSTLCKVQYTGQGLRFLNYALSSSFSTTYQCSVLHKEKYMCASHALRSLGGLFGSFMYGVPRLLQECGDNPWPVNTFSCSADFMKTAFYLGRSIWKIIETGWILGDDKKPEKVAGGIDVFASIVFIAEGILRAQGPCLGHFKKDENAIILESGGCIATIVEVSAIFVQTMSFGVKTYSGCSDYYKLEPLK